jgi:hypothetical protein
MRYSVDTLRIQTDVLKRRKNVFDEKHRNECALLNNSFCPHLFVIIMYEYIAVCCHVTNRAIV